MPTSGATNDVTGGIAGILTDPQQSGPGMDPVGAEAQSGEEAEALEAELKLVARWWKDYDDSRKFDENFRKQIAIDRKYAAGTSDLAWAVTTNLIGAFIDILVALLYARNPDVSVTKAPQVDESDTKQMDDFAKTLQIVISHLWKKGKLKKAARKGVRSVLSNAEGWFKCNLMSEREPQPETERALNDVKETIDLIQAKQKLLEDPGTTDPDELAAQLAEKQTLQASLEEKLELAVNKLFVIDYVATENMQISTDVSCIADHLDANWNANETFMEKDDVLAKFKRLTPEDVQSAKTYYQKEPKELTGRDTDNVLPQGMMTAESAQAYVTSSSTPNSPPFYRVVEIWDRRDKQIRTIVEGVKKWAKEPFPPPYPTSRFYPYFYFAFYEVDGQRHAQSLSWRLYKLQDEYSATRSNFRLTRERSIPGVLFNATMLDDTEAKKLTESKHQEYTALRPSNPDVPLANCFAPKPVQGIDPRLYDPTYILNDMERISGVQEALSSATSGAGNPITATEANLQQSGTNARTGSDRDSLEEMLTDLAQYTAEQALQCLSIQDAQRIAGKTAFWPENMSIDDLFTLVEVEIEAGTTGKPRQQVDQQAWATILPLIKETLQQIRQALATGDLPMANSLIELIKETMIRMGDESDPERFIPRIPPPGSPGAGAPPPPVVPNINISLKGEVDPTTAAALAAPALAQDQMAMQPPQPAPGAAPAPGSAPTPSPAAPAPSAGTPQPPPVG